MAVPVIQPGEVEPPTDERAEDLPDTGGEIVAAVSADGRLQKPATATPQPSAPALPLGAPRRPSIAFIEATPPRHTAQRFSSAPSPLTRPPRDLLKPPPRPAPRASVSGAPTPSPSSSSSPSTRPPLLRQPDGSRSADSLASSTSPSATPTTATSGFSLPPHTPSTAYSSNTWSTSATRSIPAYKLFARDAEPLVLPDLDRVLEEMGGPAKLSPMPESLGVNEKEPDGEEWEMEQLEKGEPCGAESDAEGVFGSEEEKAAWNEWVRGSPRGFWRRLHNRLFDRNAPSEAEEARRRALIFPPFHLLPASLTVSDLKANRRKAPALLSFQSLLLTVSNGLLGAASSSMGISMTTIEGLRDLMQMVTLLVTAASPSLSTLTAGSTSTSSATSAHSSLFRVLLVTVPSFLSLDFVSAFGSALAFLLVLTVLTLGALYELYRFTGGWAGPTGKLGKGKLDLGEGYDREDLSEQRKSWRNSYGWKVFCTFFCTSLYLPLSKLAVGALTWTDDYWPVTNPYELYDTDNPAPPSLGPGHFPSMDFCFRTTMKRRDGLKNVNWAFVILPIAGLVVLFLSLWLPWRLYQVVQSEAPRIDRYTETGERRRDLNGEYERLLDSDPSPFSYLYREYRRPWAIFRSFYLLFKLCSVLIAVMVDKNNCLFRSFSTTYLSIVRQGCLLALLGAFFLISAWSSPYIDIPSNSSDLASRVGYTVIAMMGLLAALGMPGTDGWVVATNVVLYSLNVYFAIIGIGFVQRFIKRSARRLDFSIDIFSPRIDLAKHLSRRIWQESLAALLLCAPEFAMPAQKLTFTKDDDPPYLLNFRGTVGERLVENLKILREIGLDAYTDAVACRDLSPESRIMQLRRIIQDRYTGPDMFYHPPDLELPLTSFFGRVDIIPFPFIVAFRYDQQPAQPLHLLSLEALERFVEQNESSAVGGRRKVRLALRAMEGQLVYAPHVEVRQLGATGHAEVERHIHYQRGRLRIERNSTFLWRGYNCSSGFEIFLDYEDGDGPDRDGRHRTTQRLTLNGADFGVYDAFALNEHLATLFRRNRAVIEGRLPLIQSKLEQHRGYFRREAEAKHRTLSHSFLLSVFAEPRLSVEQLDDLLRSTEHNNKVRGMVRTYRALFRRLEERMHAVEEGLRGWWYVVFDDLWRRNSDVLSQPWAFSPHYRTSICYHPMTRAELEKFLHGHGYATTGKAAFFHVGRLNQIFFYLDEMLFGATSRAIPIHVGASPEQVPFAALPRVLTHHHDFPVPFTDVSTLSAEELDAEAGRKVSSGTKLSRYTATTGDATQEDDGAIRQRAAFLFEEAFVRPRPRFVAGQRAAWLRYQLGEHLVEKAAIWLGLQPVIRDWRPSEEEGIMLDLRKGQAGWELPRRSRRRGAEEEEEKVGWGSAV
ncbi:hypothetical protein JCM10213v2_008192 [Rhodosporidiobolus nylandii]